MKKYYIYFLLCFILFNTKLFSQFGGGDGTESSPYEIWTKQHLIELGDSVNNFMNSSWVNGKHFRLMQDIDNVTQSAGWGIFEGHFHGGGNKITLAINYDYDTNRSLALFNVLGFSTGSAIVTIDSLIVDGYINGFSACGAIAYYINYGCSITNCINNVTANVYYGGGIVYGNNGGTISNCINNGKITGADRIGGIVGDNSGTVINCINTGKITATSSGGVITPNSGVGGIVGSITNRSQNISNCVNLGTVSGQGYVGGIVGLANTSPLYPTTQIIGCVNYGYISGTNGVGGILGYMFNSLVNISDCVNEGVIEGEADVGATVGKSK